MSFRTFISEYISDTEPNPLNNAERIWEGVVLFEVFVFNDTIRLTNIQSIEPGQGHGTLGLTWLMSLAEKHDVDITGTAKPTQQGRLNKSQLKDWYERHGFSVGPRGEIRFVPASRLPSDRSRSTTWV